VIVVVVVVVVVVGERSPPPPPPPPRRRARLRATQPQRERNGEYLHRKHRDGEALHDLQPVVNEVPRALFVPGDVLRRRSIRSDVGVEFKGVSWR
jgi:hypothetical protein